MSKQTFEERCLLAEQCLPDAPYRAMLKKLHTEMLAKLAEQPAQQCWKCGDMDAAFQEKCNVPACGMKEQP